MGKITKRIRIYFARIPKYTTAVKSWKKPVCVKPSTELPLKSFAS